MQLSPPAVTVGQLLRVSVPAAPADPRLRLEFHPTSGELKFQAADAASTTFLPQAAGRGGVEAVILNRQTLLLVRQPLSFDIAAAAR
jgi:hypothetical protein